LAGFEKGKEDPPLKRSSVVERLRKLRIREETVDDVVLPMKLARFTTPEQDFEGGTLGGGFEHAYYREETEGQQQQEEGQEQAEQSFVELEAFEQRRVVVEEDQRPQRASIPLPPLSEVLGPGDPTAKTPVDLMIEELMRREYLRHKFQAMAGAGVIPTASRDVEDEVPICPCCVWCVVSVAFLILWAAQRKAREMTEGFRRLSVKATHAGDISHSDWFFEAVVDDDSAIASHRRGSSSASSSVSATCLE
jgi:hypothetical protein